MLDPSIPINAGRPDPPNFTRTLGSMVSIRGGQLENQQRQQQIVQGQQAMDERQRLQEAIAGDPETLVDRVRAINPALAESFQKAAADTQLSNLKLANEKADRWSRIAASVKPGDEGSYHQAIAEAAGRGLIDAPTAQKFLSMAPGLERDAAVKQVAESALTTKEQIDLQIKALEAAQPKYQAVGGAVVDMKHPQAGPVYQTPDKSGALVPTYRQDRETGALVRGIDVPANAKITQEPAPVRVSVGDASGASANVPKGVVGDDALAGLDENKKRTVKLIANYKAQLPTGAALRAPYWQDMLGLAAAYDPTFDATQYSTRQRLRIDMTSGKSSQNVKSFNTAIAHLDTLKNRAADLHNRSFTPWNTLANLASQKAGDSAVTNFLTAADAVAAEAATAFKGTAGTDQEIKAWRQSLSSSMSPDQINGAINTISELLAGRIRETNSQYERGMGKPKDFHFLSDKSRKILGGLGVDVNDIDPAGAPKTEAVKDPLGDSMTTPQSAQTLAQKVRAKYPGVYDDLDDRALEAKVTAKYPGVYDDVPKTQAQPPVQPPPTESLGQQILSGAGEVAKGVGKGLANTAIGAGKVMYWTSPPVHAAADAVSALVGKATDPVKYQIPKTEAQPAASPSRLMDAARKDTEANGTLQKIGKGIEQTAEFFALPSGKTVAAKTIGQWVMQNAPHIATQAAEMMGLTAMQGATPGQVGAAGVVGAAAPVASRAIEATAGAIAKPAEKLVQQALGAGKERFKAMAEKVAPEMLKRNVGGVTGMSRATLLAKATTEAKQAGKAIDTVLDQSGGQAVKTGPLVAALEDVKAGFKVQRSVTPAELAADSKLAKAAREVEPGKFVTDVVLDDRTVRHLSKLQKTLTDLGSDATVSQVVAVRRVWDAIVDQAGGFTQRAKGAIGVPLKDSSEAWAKREATTAIRKVLAEDVPDLAKVNKEYAFWADIRDVLRQTEKRTAPQEGSLGRNVMTAAGMVAGASSGDGMVDRTEKAILAGALARRIDLVVRSPRWRMASAQMRNNLADAIASGSTSRATFYLNRIAASQAGGASVR